MPRVLPDRRAPMAPRAGHRVAVDVGGDPPPVVQRRVELRYLRPLLVRGRRVHPGAISLPFPRNLIATSLTSPYLPSPYLPSPSNLQVLLFGILAIEVKRKSPNCHTFLEMVKARWGTMAHIVFTYYAFATNLIVTSMLILGGADCIAAWSKCPAWHEIKVPSLQPPPGVRAATVYRKRGCACTPVRLPATPMSLPSSHPGMAATSGMNVYAASFLIPLGVLFYTLIGK